MAEINLEVWLYGSLAVLCSPGSVGYANLRVSLPEGSTVKDLLFKLGISTKERGITFINGKLAALTEIQPDLNHVLQEGDRVAFFDRKSMWPFQYRFGVPMLGELSEDLKEENQGLFHSSHKNKR